MSIDPKKIDWKRLNAPSEQIRAFVPTKEKMNMLLNMLLEMPLYVTDEVRDPKKLSVFLAGCFSGYVFNRFYELGDFQGWLGFVNILPEYKCDVIFKFWDKKLWGPSIARELRDLSNFLMKTFKLKRMGAASADPVFIKIGKMMGFKVEGTQKNAFMWDGVLYNNILLRKLGD